MTASRGATKCQQFLDNYIVVDYAEKMVIKTFKRKASRSYRCPHQVMYKYKH